MPGIFVDIQNELTDIEREVGMLSDAVSLYAKGSKDDPAWVWVVVQGLASGVEKVYSGCERVMAMIAADIDATPVSHHDGWHAALLSRVAQAFPGVRGAVISEQTYQALDLLRSFRHRHRNSYGLTLDAEIVVDRAQQASFAFAHFKRDVTDFGESFEVRSSGPGPR
ncbi:MAG: hypothetical protein Q8Q62_17170 [Mesorhizobium sp.]|nr:hypothetical protein [Mesorhizobium sp.]